MFRGQYSMTPLAFAVLFLVLAIGVFAATRGAPPPWVLSSTCAADADCPAPSTCDTARRTCTDPALPGLLAAAQSAASALGAAVAAIIADYAGPLPRHADALRIAAAAEGFGVPRGDTTMADIASGLKSLTAYSDKVLVVPGCDPTRSQSCGLVAQVAALTPQSASALFIALGGLGRSANLELPMATQAFPTVISDLNTLTRFVTAVSTATRRAMGPMTQQAWDTVMDDAIRLRGYPAQLAALGLATEQASLALYSHFMRT